MRINFELLDLRAFLAVLDLASFHAAADQLGLSQPALSRRIKGLEDALGAALLERTTRRVGPTAAGRALEPQARRLIAELEDALMSIGEFGGRAAGQVTIASVPTAAFYFLPSVIRNFHARWPEIRFRILDLSAIEGVEAVARGEAEFGINFLGAARPDLVFTPLLEDDFVLAARRDHALAAEPRLSWRRLEGETLIGVSQRSGNRAVLDLALSRTGVRLDWRFEVSHLSTSLGLVEAGLGVAVLPRLATPAEPHAILAVVKLTDPVVSRTIGLVERRGARLSPAAARFRDLLAELWGPRRGQA